MTFGSLLNDSTPAAAAVPRCVSGGFSVWTAQPDPKTRPNPAAAVQVPAFAARWVHGRGTPRLTAAFAYNRCGAAVPPPTPTLQRVCRHRMLLPATVTPCAV